VARFDVNVAAAKEAIAKLSLEAWAKPWTLSWAGKPIFTLPRHAVFRGTCPNHMIHHRAQPGVYLRLNGNAIPGMYGPSADDQASTTA
jgi:DinB family